MPSSSSSSVCPFAVALFFATATAVTLSMKKKQQQEQQKKALSPPCQVVFVLGAPGTGKGTQCELLAQRLSNNNNKQQRWVHLSAGDLLRTERNNPDSALGQDINACIAAGKLVDSAITCRLLHSAMQKEQQQDNTTTTHFLIDGFPRSKANAETWERTIMSNSSNDNNKQQQQQQPAAVNVVFVLDFVCPEETLIGRLLHRGSTSGRSDDNLDTIRKRFATFQTETAPILAYYREEASTDDNIIPVHTIPTDKPVEQVYRDVVQYFQ